MVSTGEQWERGHTGLRSLPRDKPHLDDVLGDRGGNVLHRYECGRGNDLLLPGERFQQGRGRGKEPHRERHHHEHSFGADQPHVEQRE